MVLREMVPVEQGEADPYGISRVVRGGGDVGFDIETTGLGRDARIITVAFKPRNKRVVIIDARHMEHAELHALVQPVFNSPDITLIGHNLQFDLSKLMMAGIVLPPGGAHLYDTMLVDLLIHGIGMSDTHNPQLKLGMNLYEVGKRYGIEVSKEERNWFIDLDTRVEGQVMGQVGVRQECTTAWYDAQGEEVDNSDGYYTAEDGYRSEETCYEVPVMELVGGVRPWDEPLPEEQLWYIRQDVSVPHRIKDAQYAAIVEKKLERVVGLEMRTLPAVASMVHNGVAIDQDKWREVLGEVGAEVEEKERLLLFGLDGQYPGLSGYILRARQEAYDALMTPYIDWATRRKQHLESRKLFWDTKTPNMLPEYKNWKEYKDRCIEYWNATQGKMVRPSPLKSGVNLGSWKQVLDGFHGLGEALGIPALVKLTAVNDDMLSPIAHVHPQVQNYLDYSGARKVANSYGGDFLARVDVHSRLYPGYNQLGAGSGRFSSYGGKDSFNFQQIPVHGKGAKLREAIVAAPGWSLVVADFSNIELRIVAEFSGDEYLLDAFEGGVDVHAMTAVAMFGLRLGDDVNIKEWTSKANAVVGGHELANTSYRSVGKTINFMKLYGGGYKRLAAILRITEDDARRLTDLYNKTFHRALSWIEEQGKKPFATTASGRRRYIPMPLAPPYYPGEDDEGYLLAYEEYRKRVAGRRRALANTPVQGTSADITKESLACLWAETYNDPHIKIVGCVHDENVLEVRVGHEARAGEKLKRCMESAQTLYLKRVAIGEVLPVVSEFWRH